MASALKSRYKCFASAEAFRAISPNGDAFALDEALVLNASENQAPAIGIDMISCEADKVESPAVRIAITLT